VEKLPPDLVYIFENMAASRQMARDAVSVMGEIARWIVPRDTSEQ